MQSEIRNERRGGSVHISGRALANLRQVWRRQVIETFTIFHQLFNASFSSKSVLHISNALESKLNSIVNILNYINNISSNFE